MNKAYEPTEWRDSPDTSSPLNAQNLNRMSTGLSEVDDRVIALDRRVSELEEGGGKLSVLSVSMIESPHDGDVLELTEEV